MRAMYQRCSAPLLHLLLSLSAQPLLPTLIWCTCKTAVTSPANSPLFEEALILISPPLGYQTVPASILLSQGRTQISMPVNALSYMHIYMRIPLQVALPAAQKSL